MISRFMRASSAACRGLCIATLATFLSSGLLWAGEAFPSRALRLIVPYPPGGGVDLVARTIAPKMAESLSHNVIIENRPGGSGNIGAVAAARSQPDGHTLLIVASTFTISPSLFVELPYDTVKDLVAVSQVTSSAYIVVVHPSLPASSISQLITLARARPHTIAYSSPGYAGPSHLAAELFSTRTGIRMLHVPNKGAGPAAIDLVSGQTQLMFGSPGVTLPYVRANRLRALAVTTLKRFPAAPDIPTVSEAGVSGFEVDSWYGVLVPAGTPASRIRQLRNQSAMALQSAEVRERLLKLGIEPVGTTPEEFSRLIAREIPRWASVAAAAGVKKGGDF